MNRKKIHHAHPRIKKTAKQTVLLRLLGLTLPVLDELMSFAAGHGALLEYVSKDFFFGFSAVVIPNTSDRSTTSAGTALIIQDLITAPSAREEKACILVF